MKEDVIMATIVGSYPKPEYLVGALSARGPPLTPITPSRTIRAVARAQPEPTYRLSLTRTGERKANHAPPYRCQIRPPSD